MSDYRFSTRDLMGRIKSYFLVEEAVLTPSTPADTVRTPGHFLFVADASGSMYYQMAELRSMVTKLLTLEEYSNSDTLVSVLSFSSSGDLVTHASRVKITEFMASNSKPLAEVQRLTTRGMTCISQGLKAIPALVRDGELTAAIVLSDGFANDVSPGAEKRNIDVLVDQLSKIKGLFVNTISLGAWADFKLLSFIANACSGTCFQAPSAKEVYDVLHTTATLVSGATAPALNVALEGADYAVFMSRSGGKILGSSSDLCVRGLSATDDRTIYRYRQVEEATYNASSAPICGGADSPNPILAYAYTQLAEGRINMAKYALVASRNETLLLAHARALVSTEIAAMAADIETAIICGLGGDSISTTYGLPNASQLSVLGVLSILSDNASDIEVNVKALREGYKKRSVSRIPGVRNPDGTVTAPWIKTAYKGTSDFVKVSSFDINRNNATINMLLNRGINLVNATDDTVISEVAGIVLDQKSFNNYTIVGDGTLNVARLSIKIGNKRLYRALVGMQVLPSGENFDPKATYEIVLEGRPLIAYDATFSASMLDGVFEKVAKLKVLSSILSASMKGQSDAYTPEQVAELKRHYLSTSLFFSPPTTTPYADLQVALADGSVDTRLSYKVDFGTSEMLNLGELYSANEYLARRFTVKIGGAEEKKPKFEMRWNKEVSYSIKALSARTSLNAVDNLMYPIFLDFLGLQTTGSIAAILSDAGVSSSDINDFLSARQGGLSQDEAVEKFTDIRNLVDQTIERIFKDQISPMVFYIGATGIVPDEFNVRAMTAEQVKEKFPNLSIGKKEADGTFYDVNGTVLTVYVSAEYFSTGKVPEPVTEE